MICQYCFNHYVSTCMFMLMWPFIIKLILDFIFSIKYHILYSCLIFYWNEDIKCYILNIAPLLILDRNGKFFPSDWYLNFTDSDIRSFSTGFYHTQKFDLSLSLSVFFKIRNYSDQFWIDPKIQNSFHLTET